MKYPVVVTELGKQPHRVVNERGVAVLEAAIVLSLFFLFLFGIMEFSSLLFNRAVIINASREGARRGAMFDVDTGNDFAYSPATDAEITQRVLDYSSSYLINFKTASAPQVTVSPSWASRQASGSGTPLQVTVSHQFQFLVLPGFALGIGGEPTLTARTIMRME